MIKNRGLLHWAVAMAGLLGAASSHAALDEGTQYFDTGTRWVLADTVAEGAAAGYRPASAAEFVTYLESYRYARRSTAPDVWSTGASAWQPDMGEMEFNADVQLPASDKTFSPISVTLGWLGADSPKLAGVYETVVKVPYDCSWGYDQPPTTCYRSTYAYKAIVGTVEEVEGGAFDTYTLDPRGDFATALASLKQADGSYNLRHFMVASVPEPSTWALLSLGLLATVGMSRKRKAQSR